MCNTSSFRLLFIFFSQAISADYLTIAAVVDVVGSFLPNDSLHTVFALWLSTAHKRMLQTIALVVRYITSHRIGYGSVCRCSWQTNLVWADHQILFDVYILACFTFAFTFQLVYGPLRRVTVHTSGRSLQPANSHLTIAMVHQG